MRSAAGDAPASGAGLLSETGTGPLRTLSARDTVASTASPRFLRLRVVQEP